MARHNYNHRVPHSYKALSTDMELHRGLSAERAKTGQLLVAIRDAVIGFATLTPSFHLLREHELLNQDLEDVLKSARSNDKGAAETSEEG